MKELTTPATGGVVQESTKRHQREQAVTDEVVASFTGTPDDRMREIAQSLTRHLHAFAREVRLTEPEWAAGVDFLTWAGHITDDKRQEFILLSDVLGLSMLTVAINAPADPEATESTVFGPFFVADAPEVPLGGDIAQGAKGMPCWVTGTVRSTEGTPLVGARIDVWEADEDGFYDVQYSDVQYGDVQYSDVQYGDVQYGDVQHGGDRSAGRGWLRTGDGGAYRFWSVRPSPYPIPDDGPVGGLLAATGRGPMRPAHLHFKVEAPGHRTLVTHIFVAGDPYLDRDAVFGVKDSLVVEFAEHPPGTAPDGRELDMSWASARFDIVLEALQ